MEQDWGGYLEISKFPHGEDYTTCLLNVRPCSNVDRTLRIKLDTCCKNVRMWEEADWRVHYHRAITLVISKFLRRYTTRTIFRDDIREGPGARLTCTNQPLSKVSHSLRKTTVKG